MEGLFLAATAIVVTYNSEAEIDACLEALGRWAPDLNVVVVDNSSRDKTTQRVQSWAGVRLIANPQNLGFAAAVNQGVAAFPDSEVYLLLNPDAQLSTRIDTLLQAAQKFGVAGGKLADEKGIAQEGFTIRCFPTAACLVFELLGLNRLFPRNPVNRKYRCLERDLERNGPAEQPAGAFLAFRRDTWQRLNGFDEGFFPVWFEDVDFCRRAALAGYQIQYEPASVACHRGAHSVGQIDSGTRNLFWCVSLLRYAAKHHGKLAYRGISIAAMVGSVLRMISVIVQGRSQGAVTEYSRSIWVAGLCLLSAKPPKRLSLAERGKASAK